MRNKDYSEVWMVYGHLMWLKKMHGYTLLHQKYTQYEYENDLNKLTNGLHFADDMFFIF